MTLWKLQNCATVMYSPFHSHAQCQRVRFDGVVFRTIYVQPIMTLSQLSCCCKRGLTTQWQIYNIFRILVEEAVGDVLITSEKLLWISGQGLFPKQCWWQKCDATVFLNHMAQSWDPTLGLISGLRDHRATFLASRILRARALRFVYLFFPSDYITIRFRLDTV